MCSRVGGVVSVSEIPSGTKTAPFSLTILSRKVDLGKDIGTLQVRLSQSGEMRLITSTGNKSSKNAPKSSAWFWVKAIRLAPDCHVQNVRVCRWQTDSVVLQATRLIQPGQELFLWFGEDILVNDLGISPYLSPQCIRGGKNYTCTKCGAEFEAPNPLKVHLALLCGSMPLDILWTRLASSKSLIPTPLNLHIQSPPPPFSFSVRAPYYVPPSSNLSVHNHILRRGQSALPVAVTSQANQLSILRPTPAIGTNLTVTVSSRSSGSLASTESTKTAVSEQHAHLESIMSNMGRAKNGHHVCIYCGKLYSRKYGLKIHLRTHTGYKPLQCKICQRPFGDPSNLNKHVRLHSEGNTPYRCEYCAKVLVRRRDLDRHIRSRHSGESTAH